jgi:cytochrome c peroxidase
VAGVSISGCGGDEARILDADPRAMDAPSRSPTSATRPPDAASPGPSASGSGGAAGGPVASNAGRGVGGNAGEPDPGEPDPGAGDFVWSLPPGFPEPIVPEDNAMTWPKVELGRHLFYDERLSKNETASCATCHRQALAFTDGRPTGLGSTGQSHTRGSMSLANVAYATTLTWSHPYLTELERQAAVPLFGESPVELGWTSEAELAARLASIAEYEALFAAAFPDDAAPISVGNAARSLACFERTLVSGRSPYDRWAYDADEGAISASARRGFELFYSEKLECFHCHLGFNLSDQVSYRGRAFPETPFHNTGLYNIDGQGGFPASSPGVYELTQDPADMGKFKAPTLRNIAVTAPYMHDGSIATLSEVLDHYAAGGRTIASGPNAGVGSASPLRSDLIRGFDLSEQERTDVLAFLQSLTDDTFLTNPAYANPWPSRASNPE